ncbi:hypothetical protein AVEN_235935-1 [Araneus ventricosus]|uniref:Uncharacterized protein n=1 Tax=Araneus ventricosus TaxID=182803 RepID=A0A4Y2MXB8_ARAVE|nr:hypothetical protein AVEN_235935-1 [Araneus ventricosus]
MVSKILDQFPMNSMKFQAENDEFILLGSVSIPSVSSKGNPAYVLSRGADARDLRDNDLWWQGPEFLLRDIPDPEECPCPKDKAFEQELKRNVIVSCAVINDSELLDKLLNLTNNYSKLIMILSFRCRFLKNCLHKNVETGFLTAAELVTAEQLLFKQVQSATFAKV